MHSMLRFYFSGRYIRVIGRLYIHHSLLFIQVTDTSSITRKFCASTDRSVSFHTDMFMSGKLSISNKLK